MEIRDAVESDFHQITAIYNDVLTTSTAIYNDQPVTGDDRLTWWRSRRELGYPFLVAADEGRVLGFATFGDFRPWPGYRFTVEATIHLDESSRGRGIGATLLNRLIDDARALGKHTMLAGVDSENQASLRFLERAGFRHIAYFPEVGFKFGRFLNLHFLQFWLTSPANPDHCDAKPPHLPDQTRNP